ncbi:MAG: polymer-forming cytoskeletal protein [Deltaproteobacteria bacterium]|nr:polymer-forming cytoskeletal protein [Deltaproteobacteria bacterium]
MATKLETGDGEMTIIGDSVTIRGNLSGEEDLQVLGRVEGSIDLDSTLVVAESGIVKAEVSVKNAIISGVVVGNVQASESIEITREGRMVGDVSSPRVIIVDGASFRGNVDMGDIENMPVRPPARSSSAPRAAPAPSAPPAPVAKKEAAPKEEEFVDASEVTKVPDLSKTSEGPSSKPAAEKVEKKKPSFLNPPKAKGLPKKSNKKRVVVKRK